MIFTFVIPAPENAITRRMLPQHLIGKPFRLMTDEGLDKQCTVINCEIDEGHVVLTVQTVESTN